MMYLVQAVDGKADRSALQEELNAAKEGSKERQAVEERLGEEMRRLKQHYEEELLQLRKEHQHKVMFPSGLGASLPHIIHSVAQGQSCVDKLYVLPY